MSIGLFKARPTTKPGKRQRSRACVLRIEREDASIMGLSTDYVEHKYSGKIETATREWCNSDQYVTIRPTFIGRTVGGLEKAVRR